MREASVNIEQLLENKGWLKAIAYSLVQDDAWADDIVQETWLAALRCPPTHQRAARPWLARVVRNLANRTVRDQNRRTRRERVTARSAEVYCTPEDLLRRAQLQRDIAEAILSLQEPVRSTILMRFFEKLSIRSISMRQEAPITTVRSRLSKGLEQLRLLLDSRYGGDRQSWCSILIPFAGLSAAASSVTGSVAGSGLNGNAIGAAFLSKTVVGGCWLALKGAIMTSKAALVAGLVALSGLAIWFTSHQLSQLADSADTQEPVVSLVDYENLQSRHESNLARLKRAEKKLGLYEHRIRKLQAGISSQGHRVTTVEPVSGDAAQRTPQDGGEAGFDVNAMAKLVGEHVGEVAEALRLQREGVPIPNELKGNLGRFVAQLMQHGMEFRALCESPLHDRALCTDIMKAIAKEVLNFSDSQLDQLSIVTRSSFEELLGNTDPYRLLPIDRHVLLTELRRRAVHDIEQIMSNSQLASEKTMRNWDVLLFCREWGDSMLEGVTPAKEYGLNASGVEKEILDDWKAYYALNDEQIDQLAGSASDYVSQAREVLARYGENEDAISALPPDRREELRLSLLEIQIQQEYGVASLMDESQLAAAQAKRPFVRQFDYRETCRTSEPSFFGMLKSLMK